MNILVTGGAGFIGSHVCVELLTLGYCVIVLDNLSNSNINSLHNVAKIVNINLNFNLDKHNKFTFFESDITKIEHIENVFSSQKIDAVIHLAGLKSVKESVENPDQYYVNNVNGSINLFNTMRRFNCKSIIFSSSATVYGEAETVPINENAKIIPNNPYGENKAAIERELKILYNLDKKWRIAILRFFNPIGAHKSGLIGESPVDIPNNLMPYILKVASGDLESLSIFGGDYDTHDGTGVRDYIHVMDLASGHIKALTTLLKKPELLIVNLGTGIGYSVLDVLKSFEKVSNQKVIFNILGRRAGDVATSYSDPTFAKDALNWSAKYNLEEMCHDSWNFILKNNSNND